jgi:hypothetical protein
MKRPSKPEPTDSKNATGSDHHPAADFSLTVEHHRARPTPQGGLPEPQRHLHITSHELAEQLSRQSPEAKAHAEIALAFCKECRGWTKAIIVNDWGYHYISESVSKKRATTNIRPYQRHFHYTHIDKVMAAVRDWLKPDGVIPPHHAGIFVDVIPKLFDKYFFGALDETGLSRELMAACVEADRRGNRKGNGV